MTTHIMPVILAGGSGTRLWPLSRADFPKQFLRLNGEFSLLQQTVQRVVDLALPSALVITNEAHYFLCQEQLQGFDIQITYLLEPCARNTAPAIAAAAHHIAMQVGEDTIMMVLPSDHWIADNRGWGDAMQQGARYAAESQALVTFGIKPNQPKTGYGYIEASQELQTSVYSVNAFHEKPDLITAQSFLAKQSCYWNSGMFVFSAKSYLQELSTYAADIYQQTKLAAEQGLHQHDYFRFEAQAFALCRNESIDYAVMEKTTQAVVIPIDIAWSDLGCWTAVAEANQLDEQGNALHGKVIAQDSHNCLISSEDILVTTLGVRDQIIVVTADAVLVADKAYSQQVKDIVNALGKDHSRLAKEHQRVARPWGYYEVLAEGPTFKVKRLMVKPGGKLSLQMHQHRAEHWIVVGGEASIINDMIPMRLLVNQSTYIPKKIKHRLANEGTENLYVIEVQSGSYLGEDDIVRFDDVYHREVQALV